MKVRRVASGLYTLDTDLGVFEVARVESPTKMAEWLLTYPAGWPEKFNEEINAFATLSDAKARVASLLSYS